MQDDLFRNGLVQSLILAVTTKVRISNIISRFEFFNYFFKTFLALTREEREQRDREQMKRTRRKSPDSEKSRSKELSLIQEDKQLKPGDKGFVGRARVPMPSMKDYVVRPTSTNEVDMSRITKKKPNRYEKHMKKFLDAKRLKNMKLNNHISIEGRRMAL